VVNSRNEFLIQVFRSINSLLDPLLRPIRRLMPDTGAIDFSPLVLIVAINIVIYVLSSIAA
jgi:YggT family protein